MLLGFAAFLLIVLDPSRFTLAAPIVAMRSNDSVRSVKKGEYNGQVRSALDFPFIPLTIFADKDALPGLYRIRLWGVQKDYAAPMNEIRVDDKPKDDESAEVRSLKVQRFGS